MHILRTISRILVGLVFIFSGFVKSVDPLGTAYKFGDYFDSFHIEFLSALALPLAVILISVEFILGIVLVLNVRIKFFAWGLLFIMSFFFVLTLIIAITNPVTDCGCFGDFLIISNWETFFKNVVLMGLTIFIFLQKDQYQVQFIPKVEWAIAISAAVLVLWFSVHCINHLPIVDFRPYHVGSNIPSKMEIPDDAPIDEYKISLIYEKDGIQKEFEVNDPEWQDGTWTFVKRNEELLTEGYVPPIHDFLILDSAGYDVTDDILSNYNYTFLLISHKIDIDKSKYYKEAESISLFCDQNDQFSFYAVTSSLQEDCDKLYDKSGISYPFCSADDITLKTILRSNPGLVLLKEGTIINKWHHHDFPDIKEISEYAYADMLNTQRKKMEGNRVWIMGLIVVLISLSGKIILNKYYSA